MKPSNRTKGCVTAAVMAFAMLAGGCSAGDVELNGAVFDYLGVGSKSQARSESKVPERQALVLPPNLERLPAPGSGAADSAALAEGMPVDAEQKRVAAASQAEKNHREFCDKAMQRAKLNRDLGPVQGPMGRCDRSALDAIGVGSSQLSTGSNPLADPRKP